MKIEDKYRTVAAKYYRDRINAETCDLEFDREVPTRNAGRMTSKQLKLKMAGLPSRTPLLRDPTTGNAK